MCLTRLLRRSRERSRPQTKAEAGLPQRLLLGWLAGEIIAGRITFDDPPDLKSLPRRYIPEELTPEQFSSRLRRWAHLLLLIQQRPVPCARLLARHLLSEGVDKAAVEAAIRRLAPRVAGAGWRSHVDPDYVMAELDHLAAPGVTAKLALAYAAAKHDPGFAMDVAREALQEEPSSPEAHVCLGHAAEAAGLPEEAEGHYETAVEMGATDCHDAWARVANRAGKHQTALRLVEQAPTKTPSLLLERARAFRATRPLNEALRAYNAVDLADTGQSSQVLAERAECKLSLGLPREAVRDAQRAAQGGNRLGLRVLALALYSCGRWQSAANAFLEYLKHSPEDYEAWLGLGWSCLMTGKFEEALEAGQTALRLRRDAPAAAAVAAQALVQLQRYREALDLCADHPSGADLLPPTHYARALTETGELEEAAGYISNWIERRPRDVCAWVAMGYLAERMWRFEEALNYYAQASRVAPQHDQARARWLAISQALEDGSLP